MHIIKYGFKNFMSFGDDNHEITIDRGLHLITGKNRDNEGASSNRSGKSNTIEALVWVLFGKTVKGVSADAVINWKTARNTHVWIEIMKSNDSIRIDRYRRHDEFGNGLVLSVNGNIEAWTKGTTPETQAVIESLLNIDFKSFLNSVLFTTKNETKFMSLHPEKRRAMLESLIITDFSRFYEGTKRKVADMKRDLDSFGLDLNNREIELSSENENLKHYQNEEKNDNDKRKALLEKTQKTIESLKSVDIDSIITFFNDREKKMVELNAAQGRMSSLKIESSSLESEAKNVQKEMILEQREVERLNDQIGKINNLIAKGKCHVCGQDVNDTIHSDHRIGLQSKIELVNDKIDQLSSKYNDLISEKTTIDERMKPIITEIQHIKFSMSKKTPEFSLDEALSIQDNIKNQENKLSELTTAVNPYSDIVVKIKKKINVIKSSIDLIQEKINLLNKELPYYQFWMTSFSNDDSSLKVFVFDSVVPTLNMFVNEYLDILFNGTYRLEFDRFLREKITRKNLDGKPIELAGNSQGEEQRINIAINLAIFKLLQMLSNFNSNVIFFDEAFDSGLDDVGAAKVYEVLQTMDVESKYVITFNKSIMESFMSKLRIVKQDGISRIEQ